MESQTHFEQRYRQSWSSLEHWLKNESRWRLRRRSSSPEAAAFPERYRALCQQLSLAKQRRYNPELLAYLNDLALRAHHRFYERCDLRQQHHWRFFWVGVFPDTIWRHRRYVLWASLVFLLPLLVMAVACYQSEAVIYSLLDQRDVQEFELMYGPDAAKLGRVRDAETDMYMFGFYVRNNIGVAFRTFAGGLLFGFGALFFLAYNGLLIGAVMGYVHHFGGATAFFGFVAGHSSFELTAIVLSGAAGFVLGDALLAPGRLGRIAALRQAAREVMPLVYGAGILLVVAALVEAFWSSSRDLPLSVKVSVGVMGWLLVLAYCGSGYWLSRWRVRGLFS